MRGRVYKQILYFSSEMVRSRFYRFKRKELKTRLSQINGKKLSMTASFVQTMPAELQLLVLCARTQLGPLQREQLKRLVRSILDWENVLEQAQHHGITPLMHLHLSKNKGDVPPLIQERLRGYARQNAVHNMVMVHALLLILSTLKGKGIEAFPYKGPSLAESAYGDLTLRSFKDLDIIVRPKNVASATSVLEALGYNLTDSYAEAHFHKSFFHPQTGVMVELHHDVIQRRYFPTLLKLEDMWDRQTNATLVGQSITSFTPEDTLLLLCLHGSKHQWQGLIWICDVAEYLKTHKHLDWESFLRQAEDAKISRMVLLGLFMANEVLDAPLPQWVQEKIQTDRKLMSLTKEIVARMYIEKGILEKATLPYRLQLAMRSSFLDKLPLYRQFISFLLRPSAQDRAALTSKRQATYYLIRPLRIIRQYLLSGSATNKGGRK